MPLHPVHSPSAEHSEAPPRLLTAASLFDGHDAAINIVRRCLQAQGAEVIHLGHNRSVREIIDAALQEDVQGIAVSSYQGGHVEYLQYMIRGLREAGGEQIRVFAGGGGVIVPEEARALEDYGVCRVYTPEMGMELGFDGMIEDMLSRCEMPPTLPPEQLLEHAGQGDHLALARLLSWLEVSPKGDFHAKLHQSAAALKDVPVLGITGTGGAGKSSLTDELIRRFRLGQAERMRIALLAVDPSRRRSGGALLGDRIRMNAIDHPNIFMRSIATRGSERGLPDCLPAMLAACQLSGFDLVLVETPGIGQGDSGVTELVDLALYVMTAEYGAPSQLEKIDMLDFADFVAINKFDRRGSADAYREVAKQMQRNRTAFDQPPEAMPVFGTMAAQFNDAGVTALYQALLPALARLGLAVEEDALPPVTERCTQPEQRLIPPDRTGYLGEIAEAVRGYRAQTEAQAGVARERQQLMAAAGILLTEAPQADAPLEQLAAARTEQLEPENLALLDGWPELAARYRADYYVYPVRDSQVSGELFATSLSGSRVPRIALPQLNDAGDLLRWLKLENLPGHFPFTAGVFEFKRTGEAPTRMFAGEGDPARTNRRFRRLSAHSEAKRLSTAFDSVTLYGYDPNERPDIYGKVGNSGVSIATLDDMRDLYDGFALCDPKTSVSMTINGPAPVILAMFLNVAIEQLGSEFRAEHGREPSAEESQALRARALGEVRGTVQADILKEDQGQNTCIFSTEFALKLMGDVQEYFVQHRVRNFYSVSISGYHIAEAGANPITQLAFTLANGFTYVESYLARGLPIDAFAPNLSFFFSNGMDPEYSVIGRVARRIWAIVMRDRYAADARSQKLKYHIQTSGRSLHAQELDFNDIRTTLQALIAVYDHCNSLHTNAYDEAITTPTGESVRRALAIQLIIDQEWGLAMNQNPNQGSFIIDELTDLVEAAVLDEFNRLSERGGVLGAMEHGYQRGKIQDESLHYERKKHDGSLPIIGVNTFLGEQSGAVPESLELSRSTEAEKQSQLTRLRDFQARHADQSQAALARVRQAVLERRNVFAELMDAVRFCSLGQLTEALYAAGGKYRRNV